MSAQQSISAAHAACCLLSSSQSPLTRSDTPRCWLANHARDFDKRVTSHWWSRALAAGTRAAATIVQSAMPAHKQQRNVPHNVAQPLPSTCCWQAPAASPHTQVSWDIKGQRCTRKRRAPCGSTLVQSQALATCASLALPDSRTVTATNTTNRLHRQNRQPTAHAQTVLHA